MTDAISIARSGLSASRQRLAAIASNIANSQTAGPAPRNGVSAGAAAYRPLQVTQNSLAIDGHGAGVRAEVREVAEDRAFSVFHDPQSALANPDGYVAVPNISLEEQIVDLQMTKQGYKANAKVIGVLREMENEVLDILA